MKDGEICPCCWKGKVIKEIVTEHFEYKGFSCRVDNYVVFTCPECKESIIETETLKRVEKIIRDFHLEVNHKLEPVAHICFNTGDPKGWCIRGYPVMLCSLCFNRKNGVNLNKEQFDIMKS